MIKFLFESTDRYSELASVSNGMYEYYGRLKVVVDGEAFYDTGAGSCAVFELFSKIKQWLKNTSAAFVYTSVESDGSPDILFEPQGKNIYKIYSAYQKFECPVLFSKEEIISAFFALKKQVSNIEIPALYDF